MCGNTIFASSKHPVARYGPMTRVARVRRNTRCGVPLHSFGGHRCDRNTNPECFDARKLVAAGCPPKKCCRNTHFLQCSYKDRINKFLRKAYRRGLVSLLFDIDTLIHKFDHQLFRSVQYPHHCLHHLLPEKRTINYSWQLRPRGHDYTLCHIHSTTFKNAFLNRCLFASI